MDDTSYPNEKPEHYTIHFEFHAASDYAAIGRAQGIVSHLSTHGITPISFNVTDADDWAEVVSIHGTKDGYRIGDGRRHFDEPTQPKEEDLIPCYVYSTVDHEAFGPFEEWDEAEAYIANDKYLDSWGIIIVQPQLARYNHLEIYPPKKS
jgi:hypothetical protein